MLLLTFDPMILSNASSVIFEQWPVIRVHRRIADENIELTIVLDRAVDQRLDLVTAADIAGDDVCVTALLADAVRNVLAGVGLAAGNHHLRAHAGEKFGRRTADAPA